MNAVHVEQFPMSLQILAHVSDLCVGEGGFGGTAAAVRRDWREGAPRVHLLLLHRRRLYPQRRPTLLPHQVPRWCATFNRQAEFYCKNFHFYGTRHNVSQT